MSGRERWRRIRKWLWFGLVHGSQGLRCDALAHWAKVLLTVWFITFIQRWSDTRAIFFQSQDKWDGNCHEMDIYRTATENNLGSATASAELPQDLLLCGFLPENIICCFQWLGLWHWVHNFIFYHFHMWARERFQKPLGRNVDITGNSAATTTTHVPVSCKGSHQAVVCYLSTLITLTVNTAAPVCKLDSFIIQTHGD